MTCEECQQDLWQAGEIVPMGTFIHVDDHSHRIVILEQERARPSMFDGPITLYCSSACRCAMRGRTSEATRTTR